MVFDVRAVLSDEDEVESAVLKTYKSFKRYFDDATHIEAVTYADSPMFLLDVFEKLDYIESIRVLVGRQSLDDYREELVGEVEMADRLERLRSRGQLEIELSRSKDVHSKLYRITTKNDRIRWVDGSANFSNHGWKQQTNSATIYETHAGSPLDKELQKKLDVHFEYGDPFMADLREQLELTDDDRDEVLNLWVGGKISAREPVRDLNGKLIDGLDEQIPDSVNLSLNSDETPGLLRVLEEEGHDISVYTEGDEESEDDEQGFGYAVGETKLNLSLRGLPKKTQENVSEQMKNVDIPVIDGTSQPSLESTERYFDYAYGIPAMRVVKREDNEELIVQVDGKKYNLAQELPDDPELVNASLKAFERYFDTVEKYGNPGSDPVAVKAHMFEALLWLFWAPFANRQARFYRENGISGGDLDKLLPFLYVYGPSNAGKGMFSRYALSLISKGNVASAIDADEVGQRTLRNVQSSQSSFPVLVDDIPKKKIESFVCLRNWWPSWNKGDRFPMFGAISNDTRPKEWFRNRAKILRFEVLFQPSTAGTAEVNRLVEEYNPIYEWFAGQYLQTPLELRDTDDALYEAREAMLKLYEYADRDVPAYFPHEPAEDLYDLGRGRWQEAYDVGHFTFENKNGVLFAKFDKEMDTWDVRRYDRDIPTSINAECKGYDIRIGDEERFEEWLGRSVKPKRKGIRAALSFF